MSAVTRPFKNRSPYCPDGWYFDFEDHNGDFITCGPYETQERAQQAADRRSRLEELSAPVPTEPR